MQTRVQTPRISPLLLRPRYLTGYRRTRLCVKQTSQSGAKNGIPDFDSLQLDDEYYRDIGITPAEASEQLEEVWDVDPDAYAYSNGVAERTDSDPLEDDEIAEEPFGPPAILLAGFRDHELGMARATLDSIGGGGVKVIPCLEPLLHVTVAEAIEMPEPSWAQPKSGSRSGDWGSQRTLLFSGLSEEDQLTVLDIMEGSGLPTLISTFAHAQNASRVVGEVLAEAIQQQRRWKLRDVDMSDIVKPRLPEDEPQATAQSRMQRNSTAASKKKPKKAMNSSPSENTRRTMQSAASEAQTAVAAESIKGELRKEEKSTEQTALGDTEPKKMASDLNQQSAPTQLSPGLVSDVGGHSPGEASNLADRTHEASSSSSTAPATFSPQHRAESASPEFGARKPGHMPLGEKQRPEFASLSNSAWSNDQQRQPETQQSAFVARQQALAQAQGSFPSTAGRVEKVKRSASGKRTPSLEIPNRAAGSSSEDIIEDEQETSAEAVQRSFEGTVKGAGKAFMANFEHNTFGREQRELRESAAEEMQRRAKQSQESQQAGSQFSSENVIDAVASGEDLTTVLPPQDKSSDPEEEQRRSAARQRMEAILSQLRSSAQDLPPEQQERLVKDLKVLESDQDSVEKVLREMGASMDNVPKGDRNILKAKLREEAWQPTKDAIGAALACGVSADEIRSMVDEAERQKAENQLGWYPTIANVEKKDVANMGATN